MKVVINGRFLIHRITGVERYAREICRELDKLIKKNEIIMAVPPEVENVPCYQNIKVVRVGKLHNRLWEHISFPIYVSQQRGISLNLCNVAPLVSPGIVCIHDMKIKARPQDFSKKFLMWYNILFLNEIKRARKLITVSEFSKKEIIKYYHVEPNKIKVVPNAWQHYLRVKTDEGALERYGLKKEMYYFSMCSLEPNKNFKWIAEIAKKNSNEIFAVAGSINEKIFIDGLKFDCPNNMKLLGYVKDEEAKTLMRDCKAFIYPTFYEGFGIPPLEAISAGAKQVIVSDTEVMHEIFDYGVMYINPRIYEFSGTSKVKEVNLEKYTWIKSARALNDVIKEVCNE